MHPRAQPPTPLAHASAHHGPPLPRHTRTHTPPPRAPPQVVKEVSRDFKKDGDVGSKFEGDGSIGARGRAPARPGRKGAVTIGHARSGAALSACHRMFAAPRAGRPSTRACAGRARARAAGAREGVSRRAPARRRHGA